MATGIKMPVEISSTGGMIKIEGSELVRQNIIYAIRPASSQHPWAQNITPEEDMIFDIADNLTGSLYTSHIYKVFEEFHRLGIAKLPASGAIKIIKNESGETDISITYIDLEDSRTQTISLRGV